MRVRAHVGFSMDGNEADMLLRSIGLKKGARPTDRIHAVDLFTDTDEYLALKAELLRVGKTPIELFTHVYSEEELMATELLRMKAICPAGYPLPSDDWGYKELSYDKDSACPECGNGRLQSGPLRMRRPGFGKYDFFTFHWIEEIIVSRKVRELIEHEAFSGCEFWPVLELKSGRPWDDAWQLFVTGSMPPMRPDSSIEPSGVRPCGCGKRGWTLVGQAAYDGASLEGICDFNKTHEWFGDGMGSDRKIIVSSRVYRAFRANNIKGVKFEPVTIVGEMAGKDHKGAAETAGSTAQSVSPSISISSVPESSQVSEGKDMRAEIFELLEEHGLNRISLKVVDSMRESIRVVAHGVGDGELEIGSSRIGGMPDIPEGFEWPRYQCSPLSFLAQIRLSDLTELAPPGLLPAQGLLYFFYDNEQMVWGFSPEDRGAWRVRFFDGDVSALKPAPSPEDLLDDHIFGPCRLEYLREYTIPSYGSYHYKRLRLTEKQGDSYSDVMNELEEAYGPPINRMLGFPDEVQGDVMCGAQMASNGIYVGDLSYTKDPRVPKLEKGIGDWMLLLQLDSDPAPGMMWGDEGRVYFVIREKDLRDRKFENVWFDLQCK